MWKLILAEVLEIATGDFEGRFRKPDKVKNQ
jgi:hypothetical protein